MELIAGDLHDLEARVARHPEFYRGCPALILVQAGLKYGPCRDALERHVPASRPLRESFEYCLWLHHYSRGVARSLGSAVWLARLHVIRVAEDNEAVSQ